MLLLDTHAFLWLTTDSSQLSPTAVAAIAAADELAIADISLRELAWIADRGRISVRGSVDGWLRQLADQVLTLPITPGIAATSVALPASFPRDPADRLIYATAIEHGCRLVTKDARLRRHRYRRKVTLW